MQTMLLEPHTLLQSSSCHPLTLKKCFGSSQAMLMCH